MSTHSSFNSLFISWIEYSKLTPLLIRTHSTIAQSAKVVTSKANGPVVNFKDKPKVNIVNPHMAVKFFKRSQTNELFKALDISIHKWLENVLRFEKADKKDTYLNGYKVDKNQSPMMPPSLHLIKENTTDSYDVLNDIYAIRNRSES